MIVPRDFESSTVDSCQYLRFGQTEDIWLKLALEGKKGSLLITARNKQAILEDYERFTIKFFNLVISSGELLVNFTPDR